MPINATAIARVSAAPEDIPNYFNSFDVFFQYKFRNKIYKDARERPNCYFHNAVTVATHTLFTHINSVLT